MGWGYDHIFMTGVVNPCLNQCYHRSSNDHDLYDKHLGTRTRPHPADLVRCTMIDGVQCWSSATNLLGIVTHSYQCIVTPQLACWSIPITAYPHYKGAHFTELFMLYTSLVNASGIRAAVLLLRLLPLLRAEPEPPLQRDNIGLAH